MKKYLGLIGVTIAVFALEGCMTSQNPVESNDQKALEKTASYSLQPGWNQIAFPGDVSDALLVRRGHTGAAYGGQTYWKMNYETTPGWGGYNIYKWNGSTWGNPIGGAVRMAELNSADLPYVVCNNGQLYYWTGTGWVGLEQLHHFTDVADGLNATSPSVSAGQIWALDNVPVSGGTGNQVWEWNGSGWVSVVSLGFVRIIAGGPGPTVFGIDNAHQVFKFVPNAGWVHQNMPAAIDLCVNDAGVASVMLGTTSLTSGYQILTSADGVNWNVLSNGIGSQGAFSIDAGLKTLTSGYPTAGGSHSDIIAVPGTGKIWYWWEPN